MTSNYVKWRQIKSNDVLFIGNDGQRNYDTVINLVNKLNNVSFTIVSKLIDKKKINRSKLSIPVVHFQAVPKPGRCFILVLIGKGKVRCKISNFLKSKGYVNGINFLLVA